MAHFFAASRKERVEDFFEVGKELGRGASSVVKLVSRLNDPNEKYAMKQMKKDVDKEIIRTEISILLRLRHPNIIRLREIFEDDTHLFLILEYVTGGELFDRIVEKGHYSERDAAQCVHQILSAVAYLHDNGVVHRDIKPENILYENEDDNSRLKIADFGLSKSLKYRNTMDTVCGTPLYVAPEVLLGKEYDCKVDLWAVGVITYILLCGCEPFYDAHGNEQATLAKIMKCDYKFYSPAWDDISKYAKDFVSKLLVFEPGQRLGASEALNHPWVRGTGAHSRHMGSALDNIKEFNAKRKTKAGVYALMAVAGMMNKVKQKKEQAE